MVLNFLTSNLRITLALNSNLTLVVGDSGMGKTYLVERLSDLVDSPSLLKDSSIPISEISLITIDSSSKNKEVAGLIANSDSRLLIFDEFTILANRKDFSLVETAIKQRTACGVYFILITRDFPLSLNYTDLDIAVINASSLKISLDYVFKNGIQGYVENNYSINFKRNGFKE